MLRPLLRQSDPLPRIAKITSPYGVERENLEMAGYDRCPYNTCPIWTYCETTTLYNGGEKS